MKLQGNETIASEIGTWFGTLTWIDWEHNRGKVLLDAKPGEDPVEADCTFRFAGQHWIWNMDAYPEEDIASHSAFAFCHGDRVMLIHPAPPKMVEGANGQTVADPDSPKYAAVAVLNETDDGQGNRQVEFVKRKVWPLYRLGHEAVVLNFKYAALGDQGSGFPFISDDGRREYQNPFIDQHGHRRAFGTPMIDGGTGNPRLVVTRETVGRQTVFTPHAVHEFCESDDNIPYVPDVLMQVTPNWRGRIVGWSAEDEILIDNIPVAKVTGAADIETLIVPSWKAVTRKIVHLDEARNAITVLFVTMDCNFDWRPREKSGNPNGSEAQYWYPPQYAFHVLSGSAQLDELCVYAAMETPREELPVVALQPDEAASWRWRDLQQAEPNFILNNQPNIAEGVEIAFPGHESEISFWGGVAMRNDGRHGQRRKISLVITSAADGSMRVEKRIGELEPFSQFNEDNLTAFVEHEDGDGVSDPYISRDYARLNKTVGDTAARLGDASLYVEVSGYDDYERVANGRSYYDTMLIKRYRHKSAAGDFIIAEERQELNGSNVIHNDTAPDDVTATISMIVFTHIDLRHGIYGYWDVTWLDEARCRDITPVRVGMESSGLKVKWLHYVCNRTYKILTHQYEDDIPYYQGASTSDVQLANLESIGRLVSFLHFNNPGVPGFEPGTHYCHNIWNLPRFSIDGEKLEPSMRVSEIDYKKYIFYPDWYSRAIENDIYSWWQGTTTIHGTKRHPLNMAKTGMYMFTLCPLPNKNIGIWPYYKNVCMGYPGDYVAQYDRVDSSRMLAGILFSECMEFSGANYGSEFAYTVKLKTPDGSNAYAVRCNSPGMEKLLRCTGRNDATISAD